MASDLSDIVHQAMSLPISERAILAQQLWESLKGPVEGDDDEAIAVADAKRRDAELDADSSLGGSHDDVMKAARDAI